MDRQLPTERADAVGEALEPGALGRLGAADAVVADLDEQVPALLEHGDAGALGVRVLRDVGQRLGDDVVRGDLDRAGEAAGQPDVELDGQRRPRRQRRERGGSPWSLSTAGCRPRARSRSSCSASASSSWAPASRRSASVSGPTRVASRLSRSDRETRRCCAPSCRSRSSRRRALSHAAAIRAADGGGWRRDWVMAAVSAIPERAPSGTGPESDPELGPAAFQGVAPMSGIERAGMLPP